MFWFKSKVYGYGLLLKFMGNIYSYGLKLSNMIIFKTNIY